MQSLFLHGSTYVATLEGRVAQGEAEDTEGRLTMATFWGIHNDTLADELLEGGFVSIGWDELGDLRGIPNGREGFKEALDLAYPNKKPRAIAGWAGILSRFRDEIKNGDYVVAPHKPNSTINIGQIVGDYEYHTDADVHKHRRSVRWIRPQLPRTTFSQSALYEVGSFLTVFRLRKHVSEFRAALEAKTDEVEQVETIVEETAEQPAEDDSIDEPRASRIERHTRDYILETLHKGLTHQDFEEFTADLLRALGYQARVTQYQQDGGVDVIAHKDPLGVEPPLLKIQCKHRTGTTGAPEVQQLVGTQGQGEHSVFVSLGTYSRDAIAIERQRPGLRLLGGEEIVSLVMNNYSNLSEPWRSVIRLTQVLVVADSADL